MNILEKFTRVFRVAATTDLTTDALISKSPNSKTEEKKPQTAKFYGVLNPYQQHPARNVTPPKINDILTRAESGDLREQHELFEDMEERCPRIMTELGKRKRAVISLPYAIHAVENESALEKKARIFISEIIDDFNDFEDLLFDLLNAIGHGFECIELEWQLKNKIWLPTPHHRQHGWFCLGRQTREEILLKNGAMGEKLQEFGWIVHKHKAKTGYISRSGLMRVLVWPYIFVHYAVGDLAEFLDLCGIPHRIGKYPNNATENEKNTLMRAVMSLGHSGAGIMPESMNIELKQAMQGSENPFEAMIAWGERSISTVITGGSLSSQAESTGLGSGTGDFQNEVWQTIVASDARQLEGTLNEQFIKPILILNGFDVGAMRLPKIKFDTRKKQSLELLADSVDKLSKAGLPISRKWLHEESGIPAPLSQDDALLADKNAALAFEPKFSLKADEKTGDFADENLPEISESCQNGINNWLDVVASLLDSSKSLEDFEAQLLDQLARTNNNDIQFAAKMTEAMVAARLNGMFDVQNEAKA